MIFESSMILALLTHVPPQAELMPHALNIIPIQRTVEYNEHKALKKALAEYYANRAIAQSA